MIDYKLLSLSLSHSLSLHPSLLQWNRCRWKNSKLFYPNFLSLMSSPLIYSLQL